MLGELMEEYRPKYLALPEEVYSAIRIISPACRPSGTNGAISA